MGTQSNTPLSQWSPDFGVAIGAVVAYEDVNKNGKLDLVQKGASAYIDRILGANESLLLVYVQGTVPPGDDFRDNAGNLPSRGYNLYKLTECTTATPLDSSSGSPRCKAERKWLPMTELYPLPLTSEPRFSSIMCQQNGDFMGGSSSSSDVAAGSGSAEAAPTEPMDAGVSTSPDVDASDAGASDGGASDGGAPIGAPDPSYPSASDPKLRCAPDGRSFTYSDCSAQPSAEPAPAVQASLCGGSSMVPVATATACGGWGAALDPSKPIPSNWPCSF